jgi:hypothetical protein
MIALQFPMEIKRILAKRELVSYTVLKLQESIELTVRVQRNRCQLQLRRMIDSKDTVTDRILISRM